MVAIGVLRAIRAAKYSKQQEAAFFCRIVAVGGAALFAIGVIVSLTFFISQTVFAGFQFHQFFGKSLAPAVLSALGAPAWGLLALAAIMIPATIIIHRIVRNNIEKGPLMEGNELSSVDDPIPSDQIQPSSNPSTTENFKSDSDEAVKNDGMNPLASLI